MIGLLGNPQTFASRAFETGVVSISFRAAQPP